MRKGIVATIVIYSLIQTALGLIVIFGLRAYNDFINTLVFEDFKDLILLGVLLFLFFSCGFISLGYHLNRKYKESITYWKIIIVGSLISVLASTISYILMFVIIGLYDERHINTISDNILEFILIIPITMSVFMIVNCMITSIFYKKYKSKRRLFPDDEDSVALDSNILNDE